MIRMKFCRQKGLKAPQWQSGLDGIENRSDNQRASWPGSVLRDAADPEFGWNTDAEGWIEDLEPCEDGR
jgi:hypothetical protein